jgi:hypothetical protein
MKPHINEHKTIENNHNQVQLVQYFQNNSLGKINLEAYLEIISRKSLRFFDWI